MCIIRVFETVQCVACSEMDTIVSHKAKTIGFMKDIDIVVTYVMRMVHHLGGACIVIV